MNGTTRPSITHLSVHTSTAHEAAAVAEDALKVAHFEMSGSEPGAAAGFDIVRLGRLTMGYIASPFPVRMAFAADLVHHVVVPLSGSVIWARTGETGKSADISRAVTFGPDEGFSLESLAAPTLLLCCQVESGALRRHLESLLGRSLSQPLELTRIFDTTEGFGGSWSRLAAGLAQELTYPDSLIPQQAIGQSIEDLLLTGLLVAVGHRFAAELRAPTPPLRPATVKRVLDAIEADPSRAFTTAELAAISRVSARRLQESFRLYVGMTPQNYLRHVRLDRVRADLAKARSAECSVSEIAKQWGFTHMGRFAVCYKERFGEKPSHTLSFE
ncbi:AraC family transcriptional regulator [Streptomyces boninensis]|uniref:AraC family transcriptional regulator n=1 Tax=Streptomyces boninensis TaxID=2039455 RepID=UPI003B223FEB